MWPFSSSSAQTAPEQPPNRPADRGLATDREVSSIPRYRGPTPTSSTTLVPTSPTDARPNAEASTSSCPVAKQENGNWVYPSPSQFYTALSRKQREPENPRDMYTVVPIHNAVNERVWAMILQWEKYGSDVERKWEYGAQQGKAVPMLSSFVGRAEDRSPRAWLKTLVGYQAPFDRHDWEVIRPSEQRVRYVIDFYPGRGADRLEGAPNLSFHLDVRPALDNWEGARMRMARAWDDAFGQRPV